MDCSFGREIHAGLADIWSLGCVFAELLLGKPLFPGKSGVDQLIEIIKVSHCLCAHHRLFAASDVLFAVNADFGHTVREGAERHEPEPHEGALP